MTTSLSCSRRGNAGCQGASIRPVGYKTIIIGVGEIGKPLLTLLSSRYDVIGVDLQPVEPTWRTAVMHVCYPFQKNFTEITAAYISKYRPALTIINSTVLPGTTREIAQVSGAAVVNSPVRGKHVRMADDMMFYPKWVGGLDSASVRRARAHFSAVGMSTRAATSPEASELAKLLETTYFGLCIAWAQEVERFGCEYHVSYGEIDHFFSEIPYFQQRFTPGFIGGHCVIPNIFLLKRKFASPFLDAIVNSNTHKERELAVAEQSANYRRKSVSGAVAKSSAAWG